MSDALAWKVASRTVSAFEFNSPQERERYLKEHPKADPSRHTVKKGPGKPKKPGAPQPQAKPQQAPQPQAKPAKPQQPQPQQPQPKPEAKPQPQQPQSKPEAKPQPEHDEREPDFRPPARKAIEALKGASKAALDYFKKAPAEVKKFIEDEGHRKKVIAGLQSAIKKAPKEMAHRLVETAREEVHEFKEAGAGIKAVWQGKPMTKHQKKAVKTVALHMSIAVAASALTATGVLTGLGMFAKGLARHVAMKSVSKSFGKLHTADELGHIGHGLSSIFTASQGRKDRWKVAAEPDPEQLLAAVVMKSVEESLGELGPDDFKAILESLASKESPAEDEAPESEPEESSEGLEEEPDQEGQEEPGAVKTAGAAYPPGAGPQLADLFEQGETVHKGLRTWIRQFPAILEASKREAAGLEPGLVWQARFSAFWREMDQPLNALESINDEIRSIHYKGDTLRAMGVLANGGDRATSEASMPQEAKVEFAFGNPQFRDHPEKGQGIAYHIDRLEKWANAFERWTEESAQYLHKAGRKIRRMV